MESPATELQSQIALVQSDVSATAPKKKRGRPPLDPAGQAEAMERTRLRRRLKAIQKTKSLEEMRAAVEAAEGARPPAGAPHTHVAAKSPQPVPVESPVAGALPPLPNNVLPFVRPGFPSPEQVAESMPLAEMGMMLLQASLKNTAWGPGLRDKVEVTYRKSDGTLGTKEVVLYNAITERLATVLAKYEAKLADTPEAQLAVVVLPWAMKPLLDKYLPQLLARVPQPQTVNGEQVAA